MKYVVAFIGVLLVGSFAAVSIRWMVQYGVSNMYTERVRRLGARSEGPRAYSFTYDKLIDFMQLVANICLVILIVVIFCVSYQNRPS